MRTSTFLIALLIAATFVVDWVAVEACRSSVADHARWKILAPLMISQTSLLALWLALGTRHFAWRLLAVTAGVMLWSHWFAGERGSADARQVAFHLAAQVGAVTMLALALRAAGARVVDTDPDAQNPDNNGRWQFTLGQCLCTMTGVSFLLAFVTQADIAAGRATIWSTLAVGDAVMAILCLWLVCGGKHWAVRIPLGSLGVVIVALTLVLYGDGLSGSKDESLAEMKRVPTMMFSALPRVAGGELSDGGRLIAQFVFPQILLLVGSIGIVRIAGYRLCRHINCDDGGDGFLPGAATSDLPLRRPQTADVRF